MININITKNINNSINSKINQQGTPFVNWCYCGYEVLFEKVCLFVVSKLDVQTIPCKAEKGNRVKHKQILQGNCQLEIVCLTLKF